MQKIIFIVFLGVMLTLPLMAISTEEIQDAYYKSYNYEKMVDYPDAIKSLSGVYAAYPKAYTVNLRLAYLCFQSGYYANAVDHYDVAIQGVPDAIDPKLGKMLVLMTQEKYEDAASLGYQILKLDYMNYYANLRLAYILRLQKKYELAEKVTIKLLTLYPTDVTFLTEYGALQYARKNWEQADAVFQDVLILDPENVDARAFISLLKTVDRTPKSSASVKTTRAKKTAANAPK